jgi:hypothetical protein
VLLQAIHDVVGNSVAFFFSLENSMRDLRAAKAINASRKIKLAISTMAVTSATESTNACNAAAGHRTRRPMGDIG